MLISRRNKSNVKSLTYSVFEGFGMSVKFRVKLYNVDKNKIEKPIAQEYLFTNFSTLSINAVPSLEVNLKYNGNSSYFYISEVYQSRLIRKLQKITNAMELYECKEVDLLTVTSTGTKLRSEIAQSIPVQIGTQCVIFTPFYNEDFSNISVAVTYDTATVPLPLSAYLLFIEKIKDINFNEMTMHMLNYYNTYNEESVPQIDNSYNTNMDAQEFIPKQTLAKPFSSDIMSISDETKPIDNRKLIW